MPHNFKFYLFAKFSEENEESICLNESEVIIPRTGIDDEEIVDEIEDDDDQDNYEYNQLVSNDDDVIEDEKCLTIISESNDQKTIEANTQSCRQAIEDLYF